MRKNRYMVVTFWQKCTKLKFMHELVIESNTEMIKLLSQGNFKVYI